MLGDDDTTPHPVVVVPPVLVRQETSYVVISFTYNLNDSSITNFINIKLKGRDYYIVWSYAMTLVNKKENWIY